MLLRQRVKTVTHAVELLPFCKIAFESMRFAAFLRSPETRGLQMGPHCAGKTQKGFAVYLQVRNPHERHQDALSVHRVFGLAAVTRVSPAPATEQKQHQKNDQYG